MKRKRILLLSLIAEKEAYVVGKVILPISQTLMDELDVIPEVRCLGSFRVRQKE